MKKELYLILPDIRSCHNVGAMFRTADAFGIAKIFLTGYTACPPKPQIDKVSLGAEKWVPWQYYKKTAPLLRRLKKQGIAVIALEKTTDSIDIAEVQSPSGPCALVVGNEVDGVTPDILALSDHIVHIPMIGRKESLNVSVAAGIAMWYTARICMTP